MHLHDTSFRKSAVSTKVRRDRRFTKNGLRNILNTQKSEKVRWGRGDLSGLFLLSTLSEPYLHSETAVKEICVRPMSICPRHMKKIFLRFLWWDLNLCKPCLEV